MLLLGSWGMQLPGLAFKEFSGGELPGRYLTQGKACEACMGTYLDVHGTS